MSARERITQPADQQPCPLALCDGSGFIVDESSNTASDCGCRAGRIAKRRIASLEGRVPRHYQGVSFDRPPVPEIARVAPDVVQEVRRYVRDVDAKLDAGQGLWLMGDVGTGKTTLAMIVSMAALDAGRTVAIYSLPRLLNLVRDAIDSEGGMVAFLDRLAAVDLLHIDDLGAENTTDWVLEQLYSIVNYEELIDQLGERTVSRLVAICGNGLPLYGEDDRRSLRDPREDAPAAAPVDLPTG